MDICSNYHKGADTSIQAHSSTSSQTRAHQRYRIVDKISELGNATCEELEKVLQMRRSSISARISELARDKIIVDTGKRRLTDSRKPARVYEVKTFQT